jgi:hypothetical protein
MAAEYALRAIAPYDLSADRGPGRGPPAQLTSAAPALMVRAEFQSICAGRSP